MKNSNNKLQLNILEQVLSSFAEEVGASSSKRAVLQKLQSYLEKKLAGWKIDPKAFVSVVINGEEYLWNPDFFVTDQDNNIIFIELKYTNILQDYDKLKLSLSSILELEEVKEKNIIGGMLLTLIPGSDILSVCPIYKLSKNSGVEVFEKKLAEGVTMAIFRVDVNSPSPKDILDRAIGLFVKNKPYNQYKDIYGDNPWTRVVICGDGDLEFKPFS